MAERCRQRLGGGSIFVHIAAITVEFGKHLGKGIWGLADKMLPVVYGLAYVLLVIRVLPQEEFGNFVLVQEIFLIISGLATAFALQPLLKFASEDTADVHGYVSVALMLNTIFLAVCSLAVVVLKVPLSSLFNSSTLAPLLVYIPAMLLASYFRNFCLILLQTRFRVKEIFWTDTVHFLGTPLLIWVWSRLHMFDSAVDLLNITLVSLTASSLVGLWYSRGDFSLKMSLQKDQLKKMWDYGTYSVGSTVSALMIQKADTFILAAFGGIVQVAVYNSAKIFIRVFDMAIQVISMFVFPAASKLSSRGDASSLKVMVEKSIMFSTILMLPVFVLFLVFPTLLVDTLYQGRYTEAVPVLRMFSFAALIVSTGAVLGNTLMGLGYARQGFLVGVQSFIAAVGIYFIFIPWLGGIGAALGYVCLSFIGTALIHRYLKGVIPLSLWGVVGRTRDILAFAKARLSLLHKA